MLEDECELHEVMASYLQDLGTCAFATSIAELNSYKNRMKDFDAILLDERVPDGSALNWFRAQKSEPLPTVLFVSGAFEEPLIESCLMETGVCDFICKPYNQSELKAKICHYVKVRKRLMGMSPFYGIEVNKITRQLRKGTRIVDLTPIEFNIWEILLSQYPHPIARLEFKKTLWPNLPPRPALRRTLNVHFCHLKTKLGPLGLRLGFDSKTKLYSLRMQDETCPSGTMPSLSQAQ